MLNNTITIIKHPLFTFILYFIISRSFESHHAINSVANSNIVSSGSMVLSVFEPEWCKSCTCSSPIMIGVPSVRKWLASSLPLDASSDPWLWDNKHLLLDKYNQYSVYFIQRHRTTHLTNMILDVTSRSWLRTTCTSMDPIHWRDPTNDACLSPTFTKAWGREIKH